MLLGRDVPPWKGLDATTEPRFLGYEQTERMIAALIAEAGRWCPDAVVGIARGGVVPATMAATTLALTLAVIRYDRVGDRAVWLGPPPAATRILLVDDGCSSGRTMAGARASLLAEGRDCLTLAVVHDPDCATYVPDLSHPMRELWRFPWERGEATPAARAWRERNASGNERPIAVEAAFVAVDLEVGRRRAACADPLAGLPLFAPERAVVFGAVSEQGRPNAAALLAGWGYAGLPLHCRPAAVAADPAALARHQAALATRLGCTHVIVAEADQALRIAAFAPHLVVTWWSAAEDRGYVVAAATAG